MKNRLIITVLTVIIILQMIAGLYLLKRTNPPERPGPFLGMPEDVPGPGMERHRMKGNRFGRTFCKPEFMKDKLSLNQDQTEKISYLNRKFDEDFTAFMLKIEPEKEKLKRMLDADTEDMNAVKSQLKKIEDINVEIHLLRIIQGKEISKILTPEQMKILRDERKQFFEKIRGSQVWKK